MNYITVGFASLHDICNSNWLVLFFSIYSIFVAKICLEYPANWARSNPGFCVTWAEVYGIVYPYDIIRHGRKYLDILFIFY